jgi:hypothetical protein
MAFLAVPSAAFAQRIPDYTCDGPLPPAFATRAVLGCDTLPAGHKRLGPKTAQHLADTALRGFLTRTFAEEGRTVTDIRPTVYAFHDDGGRIDAYCGTATFTDGPSRRRTLEYSTVIWYIKGGIYLITASAKPGACLDDTVKAHFASRKVSAKRVALAAVTKHLRALYGTVTDVRLTGVSSHRASIRHGFFPRTKASFTVDQGDGYHQRITQTVQVNFMDVNKRGTWRVDLRVQSR